jgi:hypothetical protein
MHCGLCGQRKGRRHCPAKGALICSHCCGTKRRVAIACPDDCVYLQGTHAGSWEGRATEKERDTRRLAPFIGALSDGQRELFLVSVVGLAAIGTRHREVADSLLAEAVGTLRRTVETRVKGILYDHQSDDVRAQALVQELAGLYEARDSDGRVNAPSDTDLLAVLRALESSLAAAIGERAGPQAFLETATRIAAIAAPKPAESAPLLIVP